MRLNIFDLETLEFLGVLTQYQSVEWISTFNTSEGRFQIVCERKYFELLQLDRVVENTENPEHVGVIKKVMTITNNQKEYLQVDGIMVETELFGRRAVPAWIVYQDMYPTVILSNLIAMALTNPAETERKIPVIGEVKLPDTSEISDLKRINYSANFPNLVDEVYSLIQNLNLGVKSKINHVINKIDIEFYTGVDRTYGTDSSIVFSSERGTIIEFDYTKDSSQNVNTLIAIGDKNVIVQAERERAENEPLRERTIEMSSECPWPTYRIEKPEDEGGTYYHYKKYNPPEGFVTNRDVWEKYEVTKETANETAYREVEVEVTEISPDELLQDSPELRSNAGIIKNITGIGSPIDTSTSLLLAIVEAKKTGGKVALGTKTRQSSDSGTVSVNSLNGSSNLKKTSKILSKATSKPHIIPLADKKVTKKPLVVHKAEKTGLGSITEPVKKGVEVSIVGGMPEITETTIVLEPYEVEVTRYITGEFLDYVYVNPGDKPSESTKIVQGSFASGDVVYYENFEDVPVEESKYREALMESAKDYLKTFVTSEQIEIVPYYLSNVVYKKSYQIGDIVTIRDKNMGYVTDLRVVSADEVWGANGYNLTISLGDGVPSLTSRVKMISKGGV